MSAVTTQRSGCCRGYGSLTLGLTWQPVSIYTGHHAEQAVALRPATPPQASLVWASPEYGRKIEAGMGTSGCGDQIDLRHGLHDSFHSYISFQQLQTCAGLQASRMAVECTLSNSMILCFSWKALDHQAASKGHASGELTTGWGLLLQQRKNYKEVCFPALY